VERSAPTLPPQPASHSSHQGPASRLTTHPVPPAARCMLEPASLQFHYCAAHWSRERHQFEPCSPWRTAASNQYLLPHHQALVAVQGHQHAHTLSHSHTLDTQHSARLPAIVAVCLLHASQGLLRLWLQLRSAANVGCAHPIQSTRRPSYIIAVPCEALSQLLPPTKEGTTPTANPWTLQHQRAPWRFRRPTTRPRRGACSTTPYSQHSATMRAPPARNRQSNCRRTTRSARKSGSSTRAQRRSSPMLSAWRI
jgi:hypothetical protein